MGFPSSIMIRFSQSLNSSGSWPGFRVASFSLKMVFLQDLKEVFKNRLTNRSSGVGGGKLLCRRKKSVAITPTGTQGQIELQCLNLPKREQRRRSSLSQRSTELATLPSSLSRLKNRWWIQIQCPIWPTSTNRRTGPSWKRKTRLHWKIFSLCLIV